MRRFVRDFVFWLLHGLNWGVPDGGEDEHDRHDEDMRRAIDQALRKNV